MNRQFLAFRGLAILLVVLNHAILWTINGINDMGYTYTLTENKYLDALQVVGELGVFAVPTFLFLSGGFFSYALGGRKEKYPIKLIGMNLGYVIPPYIFWSLIFYLLIWVLSHETYTIQGYIKNLLVGYPYHFIPLMIFFFILSPIFVWFGKRYAFIILLLIGIYQLYLLILGNPEVLNWVQPDWFGNFRIHVLSTTFSKWGIYFPLGVIYGLNSSAIASKLKKLRWILPLILCALFILNNLNGLTRYHPLIFTILPLPFVLMIPIIQRNRIPFYRHLEKIGAKAYGIYLMHIIVVNIVLYSSEAIVPRILNYHFVIATILFISGLYIPLMFMNFIGRRQNLRLYKLIFG